jgi:hypothetical protein
MSWIHLTSLAADMVVASLYCSHAYIAAADVVPAYIVPADMVPAGSVAADFVVTTCSGVRTTSLLIGPLLIFPIDHMTSFTL